MLQRRGSTPVQLTLLRTGEVQLGERIDLSEFKDLNLWLQIDLKPSISGRLRSVLYKPYRPRIAAWSNSATHSLLARGGVAEPMLAAGFLASPLLRQEDDVERFYTGGTVLRPTAYSIEPAPGTSALWQDSMRFRIYKIETPLRKGFAVSQPTENDIHLSPTP